MKHLGAVLLLLVFACSRLSRAQDSDVTDCTAISIALGTTLIDPATDPDLPVCENERNTAQCCLRDFIIQRLSRTEENFVRGLREELGERFTAFDNLVTALRNYLETVFIPHYFRSIGSFTFLNNGSDVIREFTADLLAHLEFNPESDDEDDGEEETDEDGLEDTDVDGFNVRRFLEDLVSRLEDAAVEQFARDNAERGQCIRQFIERNIEQARMEAQAEAIQQIRRVLTSIERLQMFVRNFTSTLAGFRPLQQCINTVVRLNTCGRCVAVRPPLCQNVCRAIARACYSPFNDALEDQLELFWEVVRRILDRAAEAIEELNENRGFLDVDLSTLVQRLVITCQLPIDFIGRRQANDGDEDSRIPLLPDSTVSSIARTLNGGPFDYEGRRLLGPGLCRNDFIQTRRLNCWNGDRETLTDIPEFDGDNIEDQVNNPVIDLDQDELRQQAASLGTPISAALSDPSFAQVAPQGLVIPDSNGAASVVFSFTLFTLVLVAGVFMM